ncbi:hypothetical protein [Paenibacillus sp. RUD330]|uniref:hypothetical protein n=1 Tax=Paenibacillus sp. RUD330 TaxID=2023772 RepID=UPI000B929E13|nr:hypothetical protein [Paenibacillus sp. RUD330]ASS66517.1 hypothetical protein CIC07_10390 [Paenibacillus sp. RUD330]
MIRAFKEESQRAVLKTAHSELALMEAIHKIRSDRTDYIARLDRLRNAVDSERNRLLRDEAISLVWNRQYAIRSCRGEINWLVYELCKALYELAELDHVDLNGATYMQKVRLISQVIPGADPGGIAEGVREYHESRRRWPMEYLKDGVGHAGREVL